MKPISRENATPCQQIQVRLKYSIKVKVLTSHAQMYYSQWENERICLVIFLRILTRGRQEGVRTQVAYKPLQLLLLYIHTYA